MPLQKAPSTVKLKAADWFLFIPGFDPFLLIFQPGISAAGRFYLIIAEQIREVQLHAPAVRVPAHQHIEVAESAFAAPLVGIENIADGQLQGALPVQDLFLQTGVHIPHRIHFEGAAPDRG